MIHQIHRIYPDYPQRPREYRTDAPNLLAAIARIREWEDGDYSVSVGYERYFLRTKGKVVELYQPETGSWIGV